MSKTKKHILVVDDFASMRQVLQLAFERMGHRSVTLAKDGRDALRILQQHEFDLIVCDWDMPGIGGLDVLRDLRAQTRHAHVPFLMMATTQHAGAAMEAIAAGADDLLLKPFSPSSLKEKTTQLLGRAGRVEPSAIPPDARTEAPVPPPPKPGDPPVKGRVLIVDDIRQNIDLVTVFLGPGYDILAATSGREALKIAESQHPPDLILLDIMMPEMDGLEVCRRLKSNPMTDLIPVIFLSAMGETEHIVKGLALGAVDYVTKPVNLEILNARVQTHVQLKRTRDELQREVDIQVSNVRLREDVERITHHDLKNPLSAIINISGALVDADGLSEPVREGLRHIEESAYEMLEMVNGSLDLYRMETGSYRLEPKPVDLVAVLKKVVRDSSAVASSKGISVQLDAPPDGATAAGEELLCYSLFSNLVCNAVEASPAGGKVRVVCRAKAPQVVRVKNAGTIPRDIRGRFFEKYVTSGKEGGTGLGTYSAKLMTEMQGGKIAFDTSEEAGTVIQVTLKRYEP